MSDWPMIHNDLLVPLYLEELLRIDLTAQIYFQSFPRSHEVAHYSCLTVSGSVSHTVNFRLQSKLDSAFGQRSC